MSVECFQIDRNDNVATLLEDASERDELAVRGEAAAATAKTCTSIRAGHKVAVKPIADGQHIIKYGHAIGVATRAISLGEWVHLHNCRSLYDAASSSLDIDSGARKETRYG